MLKSKITSDKVNCISEKWDYNFYLKKRKLLKKGTIWFRLH